MNAPKKKEAGAEAPFDLEQPFIMRLPPVSTFSCSLRLCKTSVTLLHFNLQCWFCYICNLLVLPVSRCD